MNEAEHLLTQRGVRITALRLLILNTMLQSSCALSLSDIEKKLTTVGKSTIFRALTVFLEHHLVHQVEDGSGQTKFALCDSDCHCGETHYDVLEDLHTHFYCEQCKRTFCLRNIIVPKVEIPEGFQLHTANYVLKGLCKECSEQNFSE
jgi:Fur family ferric uptake transcriptional regulator